MTLGLLLVAVGLLWLLADLGLLPDAAGRLWLLWPLLIVALGLELVFGPTPRGRRLSALIFAGLLLASGFWLFAGEPSARAPFVREEVRVPLEGGTDRVRLKLEAPVADLELAALSEGDEDLLRADLERWPRQRIRLEKSRRGGRLELRLGSRASGLRTRGRLPRWQLGLHPAARYELDLHMGVGRGRLDLRGLRLEGLTLRAGVGDLAVFFPERGGYRAGVEGGVGDLKLWLPAGLPVELEVEKGIGKVVVEGLGGGGGRWFASGAGEPLRLSVAAGVGRVEVGVLEGAAYPSGD